ncbi:MAG: alanine--tRNA ligase [Bacilli bacterium]|nr:alanine--tRNA ligase [Bacilli bacterium]
MKRMTSREIRDMWLKYFSSHGHKIVPSASLIPQNDDTLLWINAGVTPLKRYFDGSEVPVSKRLTNIQKCIRTNDIDNVGVTRRHHTFFEMMGNFSIGDYFRDDALGFAWELLTGKEWFDIPVEKLYVTVFPDDVDTINRWISLGMLPEHIIRLADNFWEIGPGPCGPDTEIFFDRGKDYDFDGKALKHFIKGEDNERFIEIWNNVLSQFNSEEGKERSEYKELPSKNIDTGAGLERWACIFQGADSNFDTDLFLPIIHKIEDLSGVMYDGTMPFKVIADHIRAITFALSDGATFGNVGRGYILRRLLRRSVRYGKKLGLDGLFMYKLVEVVVEIMKDVYPYLEKKEARVKALVMQEEQLFNKTLKDGEKKLSELMDESIDKTISGKDVFKLYDTYGFPYELTLEYLKENGFTTNKDEFDQYMAIQKETSKNNVHHENAMSTQNEVLLNFTLPSEFVYDKYKLKGKVIGLFNKDKVVDKITKEGLVVLDKTCFYATGGGEVNDTGIMTCPTAKARVLDVYKAPNGQNIHQVKILSGVIKLGDTFDLLVDEDKRKRIECNHSSVHLLQYSLRSLISKEISQAGSKVDEQTLRFDFNYSGKISDEELINVENKVNELIAAKIKREVEIKNINDVDRNEVMALFDEKYHDTVREVTFGNSHELCGGCHTKNTSNIKSFAIIDFTSKGSNVYRIEAATGDKIENALLESSKQYNDEIVKLVIKAKSIISEAKNNGISLNFDPVLPKEEYESYSDIVNLKNTLLYLQEEVKNLEKEYHKVKEEKFVKELSFLEEDIREVNGNKYLLKLVADMDINSLKQVMDNLVNENDNLFILIINQTKSNINFLARSNSSINAGVVIRDVTNRCGGNGGGSNKFAQGAGKDISELNDIFDEILNGKYNE